MKLICNNCFNYTFFDAEIDYLRQLEVKDGHFCISDAFCEDWNFTNTLFRNCLEDLVGYVVKNDIDALTWNSDNNCYENRYIRCAECSSKQVTIPYCRYNYRRYQLLEEEINENTDEYQKLRRKKNGNYLPVVWKRE